MYNKEFLRKLDKNQNKVIYARIIAMDFEEHVLEEIDGKITGGSLSIDGRSYTRRSVTLTMVTNNINLSAPYWGLNTKIKLEIGVKNYVDDFYPNIIWFNQGVFIITEFSSALSTTGYSISLKGMDKMCLLDGTVGGVLNCSVDFGKYEQEETLSNGEKVYKMVQQQVKDIIIDAVHKFAGEPYHNIVVADIPDVGLVLQEYNYSDPLYLWREKIQNGASKSNFLSGTIDGNAKVYYRGKPYTLKNLPSEFIYDPLNSAFASDIIPSEITFQSTSTKKYYLAKIDAGETVGYKQTLLVYPNDLIENSGSTITALLDKIKGFLGNFEYFYDIDGRFIFQKKKTYDSENWNPFNNASYDISVPADTPYSYEFINSPLFTSINYSPSLRDIKNDFTVWGKKSSIDGSELLTHMRIAIDNKPYQYTTISVTDAELADYNKKYGLNLKGQKSITYTARHGQLFNGIRYSTINGVINLDDVYDSYQSSNKTLTLIGGFNAYSDQNKTLTLDFFDHLYSEECVYCDWRELIYQMAKDYNKYGHLDNFALKLMEANPHITTGKTGYEQYYTDLEGFWRTLYKPIDSAECYSVVNSYSRAELENHVQELEGLIKRTTNPSAQLYESLESFKKKLSFYKDNDSYYYFTGDKPGNYKMITDEKMLFWSRDTIENPKDLIFWFDFLDATGDLAKFSVPNIGDRPKVETGDKVRVIAYHDTPELLIGKPEFSSSVTSNYTILQLGDYEKMMIKSAQGVSAKDQMDSLLYNHIYAAESISINCIPIYYLDVNTRIRIEDEANNIKGDYIISSLNFSLTYNGTMSMSAIKAPTKIY